MPRAKRVYGEGPGVTDADLAELQTALAGTLSAVAVQQFPPDDWANLALACVVQGYTLVVSPQMDGRAVRLSVPVGTKRLALTAGNDRELAEAVRALTLAVRKLPRNR